MTNLKNLVFAICIGSIVAIIANIKIGNGDKFSITAFALGFFVFSATYILRPISMKENVS